MCLSGLIHCPPTCVLWSLRPIDFHSELIALLGSFVESANHCYVWRNLDGPNYERTNYVAVLKVPPCCLPRNGGKGGCREQSEETEANRASRITTLPTVVMVLRRCSPIQGGPLHFHPQRHHSMKKYHAQASALTLARTRRSAQAIEIA